jgi:hypothetical protein
MIRQEIEKASFRLGDMMVVGQPDAKLVKALAVIADGLHQFYAMALWMKPNHSKVSCILSSLTVRDFLFKIGITDAEVAPVMFAIQANQGETCLHTLGIGDPDWREARAEAAKGKEAGGWKGHLVVKLPRHGYLIDTTLYQAKRKHWSDLPGMLAVPIVPYEEGGMFYGLPPLTGMIIDDDEAGTTLQILWLDQRRNKFWRAAPDGKDKRRRQAVIGALVEKFGTWKDTK